MSASPVIWSVGLRCRPEDEDAFNRWYDGVHVPMLLAGGHVRCVTRYALAPERYDVGAHSTPCPTYQTVYEFDDATAFDSWMNGQERAAAGADKNDTLNDHPYEVVWAGRYHLMTPGNPDPGEG